MPLKGSCHCGALRYEVDRLESLQHCHCITCRKTHSAAFNTAGRVLRKHFRWLAGEDRVKAYTSTPGKRRLFCGECGCHIVAVYDDGRDWVILRASSLDDDPGLKPTQRIWRSHDAPWLFEEGDIPSFDEYPPG